MATDTIDTRVAVLEKEVRHVADRLDRELATRADVEGVKTHMEAGRGDLRADMAEFKGVTDTEFATVRLELARTERRLIWWVVGTPALYLGVIFAAVRLWQYLKEAGVIV